MIQEIDKLKFNRKLVPVNLVNTKSTPDASKWVQNRMVELNSFTESSK